ncbi:DUF4491 family protein [Methanobrevibacter arboriphilus]|uniref:DUF4491 family protein n=1 Tax=Methanobrevibacter arboriphilus TaxID=39441 RepID=UPI00373FD5CA
MWPIFLIGGILSIVISLFVNNLILSALIGVLGFTLLWSIHEIIEQEKKSEKKDGFLKILIKSENIING